MNAYFADLNVLIEIIFAEESFVNDWGAKACCVVLECVKYK
jgi:hypothetical protein